MREGVRCRPVRTVWGDPRGRRGMHGLIFQPLPVRLSGALHADRSPSICRFGWK